MTDKNLIDLNEVIVDFQGEPVQIPTSMTPDDDGDLPTIDVTVGLAMVEALTTRLKSDEEETLGSAGLARHVLAKRINTTAKMDFSAADTDMICERVLERWERLPLVACEVVERLDPKRVEDAVAGKAPAKKPAKRAAKSTGKGRGRKVS